MPALIVLLKTFFASFGVMDPVGNLLEWTPYTRHIVSFRTNMNGIWASTSTRQRGATFSPTSRAA